MPPGAVIGRPWTREEDDRLTTAVAIHGEYTEKWKTIAQSVPGRTNKACRKVCSLLHFLFCSPYTSTHPLILHFARIHSAGFIHCLQM